ncbi:MAG TPA: YceD family protein [Candidatus Nanopelagicaceae bacterium]|nr:YceD family protein [Candidatus Nanopelagicaceae bacterium]
MSSSTKPPNRESTSGKAASGLSKQNRHPNRLDPKAPFVVDTHDLGRSPGSLQEQSRSVLSPTTIGLDVIAIAKNARLDLAFRLQAVSEGVLVSGQLRAEASGECVRCLEPMTLPLDLRFQDLFTYEPDLRGRKQDRNENEDVDLDEADPLPELVEELADLEPVIIDAVVLNLPYQPHCRPDCPGLCPECGALLADDPDHHHEEKDARWSSLAGLVFEESASVGDTEHLSDGGSSLLDQEES